MSVADQVRAEQRSALERMTTEERIALAFRLGERDLALFMEQSGLSRAAALLELKRRRQAGRVFSKSASL